MRTSFIPYFGAKRDSNLENVISNFPADLPITTTYVEPFVGAGNVWLNIECNGPVILNDKNPALINCFRYMKCRPNELKHKIQELFRIHRIYDYDDFYKARMLINELGFNCIDGAAWFVFLMHFLRSAEFRFNNEGMFNGSHNKRVTLPNFQVRKFEYFCEKLRNDDVQLICGDFQDMCEKIPPNSVCYLDPPYTRKNCKEISRYCKQFSASDGERRLKEDIDKLRNQGCLVIMSNFLNETTDSFYQLERDSRMKKFKVFSKSRREMNTEVLAVYN